MERDEEKQSSNLYEILGIRPNATQEDIRKAYKKQAQAHHPDNQGDPDKFHKVCNAYEVLSDAQKREIYDTMGEEGLKNKVINFQERRPKCKSRLVQEEISLNEAFSGCQKDVEYAKTEVCVKCEGTGAKSKEHYQKCEGCFGKGFRVVLQQSGFFTRQQRVYCPCCDGAGAVVTENCEECKGERFAYTTSTIIITIPAGIKDGHRFVLEEKGDEYPEADNGDIILEINIVKHKLYERTGNELSYTLNISLAEALCGFSKKITHLDSKEYTIESKEKCITPKSEIVLEKLGMPIENTEDKGDLKIKFHITIPENSSINSDQAKCLSEIFDKIQPPAESDQVNAEACYIQDFVENEQNTHHKGGKVHYHPDETEEDEDEEANQFSGNAKVIRCAHQ